MADRVLVLGGGVSGLTAAHELAERGFAVTVLERRPAPGGKARSMGVPDSAEGGRRALPAEHGFRFFPGFYQHLPDTMRRIPHGDGTVFDHLLPSTRAEIARAGRAPVVLPMRIPGDREDRRLWRRVLLGNGMGLRARDSAHFAWLLLRLSCACDARRYLVYEEESWWRFVGADRRPQAYQQFLADGLTRTLVAARAREMSARTGGDILLQLLASFWARLAGRGPDRVLDGPTSDVWIDPWVAHLRRLGVELRFGTTVRSIELSGRAIRAVWSDASGTLSEHAPDWVVSALPVEQLIPLVTPAMTEVDPRLGRLDRLVTRWMNGVMFYLRRPVPVCHGHVIHIDSPWSLTSISQAQFWAHTPLDRFGDGTVADVLSVDVSDWDTPGLISGKPAMACSRDEIVADVWLQLCEHLNGGDEVLLEDADLLGAFVDEDIVGGGPHPEVNLEPLLVNTAGSWADRPTARTAFDNLFLAGDFVRTYTDLATMEGANEAARRAVNALLDAAGSPAPPARVFPLHEPAIFAPFRAIDRARWRLRHRPLTVGPGEGT